MPSSTADIVARNIPLANQLREFMARRNWGPQDFSEAIGLRRNAPNTYLWLNGSYRPGRKHAQAISNLTGIPFNDIRGRQSNGSAAATESYDSTAPQPIPPEQWDRRNAQCGAESHARGAGGQPHDDRRGPCSPGDYPAGQTGGPRA